MYAYTYTSSLNYSLDYLCTISLDFEITFTIYNPTALFPVGQLKIQPPDKTSGEKIFIATLQQDSLQENTWTWTKTPLGSLVVAWIIGHSRNAPGVKSR